MGRRQTLTSLSPAVASAINAQAPIARKCLGFHGFVMKKVARRICLGVAAACLLAFLSASGPRIPLRRSPLGAMSFSVHFGLSRSPWLSYERNAHFVDGTFRDGLRVHWLSWSWVILLVFAGSLLVWKKLTKVVEPA